MPLTDGNLTNIEQAIQAVAVAIQNPMAAQAGRYTWNGNLTGALSYWTLVPLNTEIIPSPDFVLTGGVLYAKKAGFYNVFWHGRVNSGNVQPRVMVVNSTGTRQPQFQGAGANVGAGYIANCQTIVYLGVGWGVFCEAGAAGVLCGTSFTTGDDTGLGITLSISRA